MSHYLVRLLALCWITGRHTIYPPSEGLLPSIGIESTPFRNSAAKRTGLHMHTTTPSTSWTAKKDAVLFSNGSHDMINFFISRDSIKLYSVILKSQENMSIIINKKKKSLYVRKG